MKPFQAVLDRMVRLAEDNPDRIAEPQYFNDRGEPCCLVGHTLFDLGVRPDDDWRYLVFNGRRVGEEGMDASSLDWAAIGIETPSPEEEKAVNRLQRFQDAGMRWNASLNS